MLALAVAVLTPAFEANDEQDHLKNVRTLASGQWYRLTPGSGFEAHQAPLYYFGLTVWGKAFAVGPTEPELKPAPDGGVMHGIYDHTGPKEGRDQRRVVLFRLPSVVFGLLTILLTAAAARRLSDDPWSPVVAAAFVAGVPKFTFLSGVVNNDNLSNVLGGVGVLLLAIALARADRTSRQRLWLAAGLGLTAGALVLTKISALPAAAMLVLGLLLVPGERWQTKARWTAVFAAAALAVCGWWLIQNQVRYGDPFNGQASKEYLEALFPPLFDVGSFSHQAFDMVPRETWRSFWYISGHNQFFWRDLYYLPFWIVLFASLIALAAPLKNRPLPAPGRALIAFSAFALAAMASIWVLGIQTTTSQARVAFLALPAIGFLFAGGLERVRLPVVARFALPALGLIAAFLAIRHDIIGPYGL